MKNRSQEFELGADVTGAAAAKVKKQTAVLSVRLTVDELSRLEAGSRMTGKAVSQLLREALKGYLLFIGQESVNVTVSRHDMDTTVSAGGESYVARGSESKTLSPETETVAA